MVAGRGPVAGGLPLPLDPLAERQRAEQLERENAGLSQHLAALLEETSLLRRLTENLKIGQGELEMGRLALQWLQGVLPAKGLAVQLLARRDQGGPYSRPGGPETLLLARGQCPLDNEQFTRLMEYLVTAHQPPGRAPRPAWSAQAGPPLVINRGMTQYDDWPFPQAPQMIVVPLAEEQKLFGWLAAFDHVSGGDFGSQEASLLSSVAAILGIHCGNLALYQQQTELMAGIIRALAAAIDAKDVYTCGHSDHVARIALRLAEELGCDALERNTIYLAGLLHNIGNIGIADSVLRKPGKLSDEEFQHIQTHAEIGHRILRDLTKLDNILPIILHHHEAWDGSGYPLHLQSEAIPRGARIVAVADAYEAMSSDRPYRPGMPDEKIDEILRSGAGGQWDPEAVAAFFRARDDLRRIVRDGSGDGEADPAQCR
jgi:HD-GYP domain-containing protein (c-di-GMP phosphodiesterase class II)